MWNAETWKVARDALRSTKVRAFLTTLGIVIGSACLVKVGRMDVVAAQIVWKKTLAKRLVHLGLQYLE